MAEQEPNAARKGTRVTFLDQYITAAVQSGQQDLTTRVVGAIGTEITNSK